MRNHGQLWNQGRCGAFLYQGQVGRKLNVHFCELRLRWIVSLRLMRSQVDYLFVHGWTFLCSLGHIMSWDSRAFRHWMCNRIVFGNPIFLNCIDRLLIPVSSKVPDSSKDMAIDLTWRAFLQILPKRALKGWLGERCKNQMSGSDLTWGSDEVSLPGRRHRFDMKSEILKFNRISGKNW